MSAPQKPVLLLRNDIWALGCMLVYMLTNKLPFFPSPEDFKQKDFCVDELEQEDFVMQRHMEWVSQSSFKQSSFLCTHDVKCSKSIMTAL